MGAALRILRLLCHIASGVAILMILWPHCDRARRQAHIRRWSAKLLGILRLTVEIQGRWPSASGPWLLTSNHISWVDIFVIQSLHPVRFVSKAEVRHWPLFGWLAAKTGTLFLDRTSHRQTLAIGQAMMHAMAQGDDVGLFPESTTSSGEDVLPFKTSLFQEPLKQQITLLPVALRYPTPAGSKESDYPFIGDMTFAESLKRILLSPPSRATLSIGAPCLITDLGNDRRSVAQRLYTLTRALAGLAPS